MAGAGVRWQRIGRQCEFFKVIDQQSYRTYGSSQETLRRRATVVGPNHRRNFEIQISRGEYCEADHLKEERLDDYDVRVYSLEMIAIEKMGSPII